MVLLWSFNDMHMCRVVKNLSCSTCLFLRANKVMLYLPVSVLILERVLFADYLMPCFHIFVLLLVILLSDMAPKYSGEVLSNILKHKKTVM